MPTSNGPNKSSVKLLVADGFGALPKDAGENKLAPIEDWFTGAWPPSPKSKSAFDAGPVNICKF